MTKENKLNFITIYKILLSISIVVSGICLIWGCVDIYLSGDGYSRQIVIDTFSKICVPIYICIAFIIGSICLNNKGNAKFYKPKNFKQNEPPKINRKTSLIIKTTIIVIGAAAVVFGAITGGFADVLTKAVNICTECIGLG